MRSAVLVVVEARLPQNPSGVNHPPRSCSRRTEPRRYHSNFSANCTWRAVVEVLDIAPAVPDTPVGVKVIRAGVLKLARFSRLKISARNCRLSCSRNFVFLIAEKSQFARPGPTRLLRAAFP